MINFDKIPKNSKEESLVFCLIGKSVNKIEIPIDRQASYKRYNKRIAEKKLIEKMPTKKKNHNQKLKKYGLNELEYERMILAQNSKCAICGKKRSLCVDHCHKTGKIRGLLCSKCNIGIGFLQDSVKVLGKAIKYLKG